MKVIEINTNSIKSIINSIRYIEGLNHNVPRVYEIVISVLDSESPVFKYIITDENLDVLDNKPKHHVYRLVVGKLAFYFLGDFYQNGIDKSNEEAVKSYFNSYHHRYVFNQCMTENHLKHCHYRYSYKQVTDAYHIEKILEDCENGGNIIKVPKTL